MRNNESTIKQAIKLFLKKYNLEDQVNEGKVYTVWNKTMGPFVVNRTTKLKFINGKLVVYLNSSALRNELLMAKTPIIEKLNEDLEEPLIKELEIH